MESIVVIGAGMAGLATALVQRGTGRSVTIVERDPVPPELSPDQAFECWKRPGVPQFRHAHILLARLQTTLRDEYPDLLAELLEAGIELSSLTELLPEAQARCYVPASGDEDLQHLWGRRPTFEYIVRRYVGRLPHVRFVHGATVTGLLTESTDERVRVTGLELERAGGRETIKADIVIDGSGKRSKCHGWLGELGVKLATDRFPSDRVYVCRHYRLNDPTAERPLTGAGANLDYFGFVTFYAEHGHFAITLSCPVEERAFAQLMSRPQGFERICDQVPVLRAWIERAHPTGKVLGAGQFANAWTRFALSGGRKLEGFFAIGDAHIETNPMYGRGCTSAFVQARAFADALAATPDGGERLQLYADMTRDLMQAHFDFCVSTDNVFRGQGRRSRGEEVPGSERLLQWAYVHLWTPALERSTVCSREMVRAMQMREVSRLPVRLMMVAHIFFFGLLSLFQRRKAATPLGPNRSEAMRTLLPGDGE